MFVTGQNPLSAHVYDPGIQVTYPTLKSRVLCFGRDLQLLRTRLQVLARAYDAVEVSSIEELETLPTEPTFQLVLLCHTLSSVESQASAAIIQQRWPHAKIMALTSGVSGAPYEQADAIVLSAQGPVVLLQAIDRLICRSSPQPSRLPH